MASTSTRIRSALLVLMACGGHERTRAPAKHPWDGKPLPSVDAMRTSKALDCVLRVAAPDIGPFSSAIADEAPPAAMRACALAMATRAPGDPWAEAQAAEDLAERGSLDDARALVQRPEVSRVIGSEWEIAVGLPIAMDGVKSLPMIREAALAGRHDDAARAYDALTDEDFTYAREDRIAALVALGRESDAEKLVDAAPSNQRWEILVAWVRVALRADRGVEAAVRLLLAERVRLGPDDWRDGGAVYRIVQFARVLGRPDEVAPLRAALIDGVLAKPNGHGEQVTAIQLADELGAIGAADELLRERGKAEPAVPAGTAAGAARRTSGTSRSRARGRFARLRWRGGCSERARRARTERGERHV